MVFRPVQKEQQAYGAEQKTDQRCRNHETNYQFQARNPKEKGSNKLEANQWGPPD